jgi:hypothetical protein
MSIVHSQCPYILSTVAVHTVSTVAVLTGISHVEPFPVPDAWPAYCQVLKSVELYRQAAPLHARSCLHTPSLPCQAVDGSLKPPVPGALLPTL